MIYLDYSANTPVNKDVLDTYNKICNEFIGNPNSLHELGISATNLINSATKQIQDLLNTSMDVLYTSGSSEANNLAIKGIALKYMNRGKHIITSYFEHSSVYGPLKYLESLGFEITRIETDSSGIIDIDKLKEVIREDTILVTINAVNSELGILEPIEKIGRFLKNYPKCFFHVDLTQAIGKVNVSLDNIDLASFSAHKIYGLKGIGCLLKKNNILLEPLIHGGKSTTIFRSGTPDQALIGSFAKALRLSLLDIDKKYNYVKSLNNRIKKELSKLPDVLINSNDYSIPHILNISVLGVKAETFMHALSKQGIYISTLSACSDESKRSEVVYYLTKDDERSKSSLRISISYLTKEEEIDEFITVFKNTYNELKQL